MKEGWQTKKLREVCELVNGRAYRKPELLAAGKYRVLRVGNFFTNDHWYYSDMELEEKKYCDNGDLLYAWSASFGPRIWTGGKAIYHYHIWKVLHDCAQIDQMFLFYFFQWDTEKIKADQGTGTTMMHVSMGSMNERVIHLPRWPNSSESWHCSMKRLLASPPPKPAPNRTSRTPVRSLRVIFNPSSASEGRGG